MQNTEMLFAVCWEWEWQWPPKWTAEFSSESSGILLRLNVFYLQR